MTTTKAPHRLKILHIAYVDSRSDSGISVTVPKHLEFQSKEADVTLLNIYNFTPENAVDTYNVFFARNKFVLQALLEEPNRPDLVVFHEIYRPYFIKAYKELVKQGVPYVIIPHGSLNRTAQNESKWKKRVGNMLLFNNFINASSSIQYMSDKEKIHSIANKKPGFVQGSGINILGRKKSSFSKIGLKIIYVGRLDIYVKGIDLLLESALFNKTAFRTSGIKITIAGSDSKGGYNHIVKFIDKNDLGDFIKIHGPVYGEAKIKKLLEHDVFIQLSRTEAQCLGLMEAMDIGLPSIVSPGSTFYEAAKKYKIAIPCSGSRQNIAETIMTAALNKNNLSAMSLRASTYISKEYNWDKVGHRMVKQYIRIMNNIR